MESPCTIVNSFNGETTETAFTRVEDAIAALQTVAKREWGGAAQGSLADHAIVVPLNAYWGRGPENKMMWQDAVSYYPTGIVPNTPL
jgi:hypothetical protein